MAQIPHKARRYGYKLKKRFREDPFSTLILYALFFSLVFLVFAFRGLIATIFIKPIGVINPGLQSTIETATPGASETTTSGGATIQLQSGGTYTVKPNDTLYGIAIDLEIDWEELARLNDIVAPYSLSVGQVLKLPSS